MKYRFIGNRYDPNFLKAKAKDMNLKFSYSFRTGQSLRVCTVKGDQDRVMEFLITHKIL